jgi:SAM-dependent methyltransferase
VGTAAIVGRVSERERVGDREALPAREASTTEQARSWARWLASRVTPLTSHTLPPPETDPIRVGAEYDRGASFARQWREKDPRAVVRFWMVERPMREAARSARDVLDLGCGWGRVLDELPKGANVVGVDVSFESLRLSASRGHRVVRADAHRLPFPDASFDVVIAANGVFRHLDAARAMAECARVLRPGGTLLAHFWNARGLALRSRHDPGGLSSPREMDEAGARVSLRRDGTYLYRNVRFRPYAVRLPNAGAWKLFSHAVLGWRRK